MFLSDKEISKVKRREPRRPRKRTSAGTSSRVSEAAESRSGAAPSASSASGAPKDPFSGAAAAPELSVVEKARLEREERQKRRLLEGHCVRIQRMWRGYAARWRLKEALRAEVLQKMADLKKVRDLLRSQKGADFQFCPPSAVTIDLIRRWLAAFSNAGSDAQEVLQDVITELLLPSPAADQGPSWRETISDASLARLVRRLAIAAFSLPSSRRQGTSEAQTPLRVLANFCSRSVGDEDPAASSFGDRARRHILRGGWYYWRLRTEMLSTCWAGPARKRADARRSVHVGESLPPESARTHFAECVAFGLSLMVERAGGESGLRVPAEDLSLIESLAGGGRNGTRMDSTKRMANATLNLQAMGHFASAVFTVPLFGRCVAADDSASCVSSPALGTLLKPSFFGALAMASVRLLQADGVEPTPRAEASTIFQTALPTAPKTGTPAEKVLTSDLWLATNLLRLVSLISVVPRDAEPATASIAQAVEALAVGFARIPDGILKDRGVVSCFANPNSKIELTVVAVPQVLRDELRGVFVRGKFLRWLMTAASRGAPFELLDRITAKEEREGNEISNATVLQIAEEEKMAKASSITTWLRGFKARLTRGLFGAPTTRPSAPSNPATASVGLLDTSNTSRTVAEGRNVSAYMTNQIRAAMHADEEEYESRAADVDRMVPQDPALVDAICRFACVLWTRWPPHPQEQTNTLSLLNAASFASLAVPALWATWQERYGTDGDTFAGQWDPLRDYGFEVYFDASGRPRSSERWPAMLPTASVAILGVVVRCVAHQLIILEDQVLYEVDAADPETKRAGQPKSHLSLAQLRRLLKVMKKLIWRMAWDHGNEILALAMEGSAASSRTQTTAAGEAIIRGLPQEAFLPWFLSAGGDFYRTLHDRNSRRPLAPAAMWVCEDAEFPFVQSEIKSLQVAAAAALADYRVEDAGPMGLGRGRVGLCLGIASGLVPFRARLWIWKARVEGVRNAEQEGQEFGDSSSRRVQVRIRRGYVLEDGLRNMGPLNPAAMRGRVFVIYVNPQTGEEEAGIDMGGLFKEFLTDLCAHAFNPDFGLFQYTENDGVDGRMLYPNPSSGVVFGSQHLQFYYFIGSVLGKALLEGITVEPRFAHSFLSFLRGRYNALHMMQDLRSLDMELYKQLLFLARYDGDVEDLCLTFSVTESDGLGGELTERDLIPGGRGITVTKRNRLRYTNAIAKHYVVDRVAHQASAFMEGFRKVLGSATPGLLMFNEPELQLLVSGTSKEGIDMDDLRRHTRYSGGYHNNDSVVRRFWKVVKTLTPTQQALFLRFTTSCQRPPPLGFETLNPRFTIQRASGPIMSLAGDNDRLPTASTCFNILKLPAYSSEKVLREKLLLAIESGAGFDLS